MTAVSCLERVTFFIEFMEMLSSDEETEEGISFSGELKIIKNVSRPTTHDAFVTKYTIRTLYQFDIFIICVFFMIIMIRDLRSFALLPILFLFKK